MRKYKFRAWADGQMLDDISTYTDDFTSMLNKTFAYLQESENVKFMQFTGLLDKNGKEVYEGDIVSIFKGCPSIVKFGVQDIGNDFQGVGFYTEEKNGSIFNIFGGGDIEVIGNIYENPELLES